MVQVQLRMPERSVDQIDTWVAEGMFKNRSDAVRSIVNLYEERLKTTEFFKMLMERSKDAKEKPETFISLEEVDA